MSSKIYSSKIKQMCFLNFRFPANLPKAAVNKIMLFAMPRHPCADGIVDAYCWACEGKCQAEVTETCQNCGVKVPIGCERCPRDPYAFQLMIIDDVCDNCHDEQDEMYDEEDDEA